MTHLWFIPVSKRLHGPFITSHNIYYVKLNTIGLASVRFYIIFDMWWIWLCDNAIVNNFSTDLSIKMASRAQPPKNTIQENNWFIFVSSRLSLRHSSPCKSQTVLGWDFQILCSFGRDASGVASLLGELVCTSSTGILTARREDIRGDWLRDTLCNSLIYNRYWYVRGASLLGELVLDEFDNILNARRAT